MDELEEYQVHERPDLNALELDLDDDSVGRGLPARLVAERYDTHQIVRL